MTSEPESELAALRKEVAELREALVKAELAASRPTRLLLRLLAWTILGQPVQQSVDAFIRAFLQRHRPIDTPNSDDAVQAIRAEWEASASLEARVSRIIVMLASSPVTQSATTAAFARAIARVTAGALVELLPTPETGKLLASLLRRLTAVGFFALLVGFTPIVLLTWQNRLIQEQLADTQAQSRQAHRSRLIEVLFGTNCTMADGDRLCTPAWNTRARREAFSAWQELMQQETRSGLLPFQGARLDHLHLFGKDLEEGASNYTGAILDGAIIAEADATGLVFVGASMRATQIAGAELDDVDFLGANLQRAWISDTVLQRARLIPETLEGAHLYTVRVEDSHLLRTNLDGARLYQAIFNLGHFVDTSFRNSVLDWCSFANTEMTRVCMRGATMSSITLTNIRTDGLWMIDARDARVDHLSALSLDQDGVLWDEHTIWPAGFTPRSAKFVQHSDASGCEPNSQASPGE